MLTIGGHDVDEAQLAALCRRYGIAQLQIFGSAARGRLGPHSDIDILYTVMPGRHLGWEIEEFADQLQALFGRPVDLVSRRALHHRLRDDVLAEAQPLYAA